MLLGQRHLWQTGPHKADLVILNQNLFEVHRYDVHRTKPDAVIMDGALVHGEL